jgi:hypothetical protein
VRAAQLALAVGLLALAGALVLVLTGSPAALTGTNGIEPIGSLATAPGSGSGCQGDEVLPAHTSAIRLSLDASAGPRVTVTVSSRGTVLARGESAPGWLAKVVAIPVRPLDRTVRPTTVCFAFTGKNERVSLLGAPTSSHLAASSGTKVLPGRISIEYVRDSDSSWWSLVLPTARRMGLGRAWAGTWVAVVVASLMAAALVLGSWLTIRESR